jgi:ribosomal protein S27AE
MTLHIATRSAASPAAAAPSIEGFFARPCCPRCGIEQLAPERSTFVGDGVVRHAWSCEDCGAGFSTAADFGAYRG